MQTKDLTIEYAVTFKSNRGNFNHQPITTLVNNTGLYLYIELEDLLSLCLQMMQLDIKLQ